MNWYLAETHTNREAMVAYTMRCLDIEPFLPLILRTERVSPRTRQKELASFPAIPGHVFFKASPDMIQDVNTIKDVKGIFKAADMTSYAVVPERQMQAFIDAHDRWHDDALKAHLCRRQIRPAGQKKRFKPMDEASLKEIMDTLFPEESVELASVA